MGTSGKGIVKEWDFLWELGGGGGNELVAVDGFHITKQENLNPDTAIDLGPHMFPGTKRVVGCPNYL